MKNNKFMIVAIAAMLLSGSAITRSANSPKAVPPSNPFIVLLEGTYAPAGTVRDLGLLLPNLNNGAYVTVPIYNLDSGVPGPTDEPFGNFYALGGENDMVAYDLGKGALTARFVSDDTVVTPDGSGGIFITGTYELDILEAVGIYRSFAGGSIHMVDVLQVTVDGQLVEHCFCIVSRKHGKPE